jgi:hypothetical protein
MKSCGANLLFAYFRCFIFGFLVISQISFKLAATTPIIGSKRFMPDDCSGIGVASDDTSAALALEFISQEQEVSYS